MRKDVRTGAVIGGLLIAVLILYGVVASRSHKKPGVQPVALGTDKTIPDAPGGADHPDATPTDTAPAPIDAGPTPAPNSGVPAPAPTGPDSANPAAPTPDSAAPAKGGVSWAALLRADNVENLMPVQTQTPDPSAMDVGSRGGRPTPTEAPPVAPSPRHSAADN